MYEDEINENHFFSRRRFPEGLFPGLNLRIAGQADAHLLPTLSLPPANGALRLNFIEQAVKDRYFAQF